jgi:CheY-like chemotaxis protein
MDGLAAAQQINRECNLPILFLTANSDPDSDQQMRQAGFVGRIMKPFDKRDIRIQIEKALKFDSSK